MQNSTLLARVLPNRTRERAPRFAAANIARGCWNSGSIEQATVHLRYASDTLSSAGCPSNVAVKPRYRGVIENLRRQKLTSVGMPMSLKTLKAVVQMLYWQ